MDTLKIVQQIPVKAKVTENFKTSMLTQMQEAIRKIDLEMQNIDFQTKRTVAELEKQNPPGISSAKKHYENEKAKRIRAKEQLTQQIKELGKLPVGSEVVQGSVDVIGEIRIGDNWRHIFETEVLLCDDVIVEIRRKTAQNGDAHE